MKKRIILLMAIFIFSFSFTGYSAQWGAFEHRYEYELKDVLDASRFVEKKGYWEGYRGDKLAGYVLLSKDWTEDLIGYSGKHMETLVGMDGSGVITGIKLLFHSEPIVLIGLKEKNYQTFLRQYPGKSIKQEYSVGKGISMDAVTGATVTAVVQNAIIMRSARKVASQAGMIEYAKGTDRRISKTFNELSWGELITSGAIKNIRVKSGDLGIEGEDVYLDLYFGIVTVPSIGRNVLGENMFNEISDRLEKGESAIFIFSRGKGSFKGSGFARGGIFERFSIEQQDRAYAFRDRDYSHLNDIKAKDAPSVKEGGLFIVRGGDFQPAGPFTFRLILPYRTSGKKEFKSYSAEYKVPDRFIEK